ncbi:UNVERIFIED_CONTAM: hypothetical protein Slati_0878300, partial [Sesamum latifolium]
FIGLLETRVAPSNYSRVQVAVMSAWKWFTDSTGPTNRIWLAWDDSEVDVEVPFVFTQCIHCKVVARRSREYAFITIIYGSNDLAGRRELCEVYGSSGDITAAIDEFHNCILDTGLLDVPLQGAIYTWHNCSDGPRSLWKKLGRMLANDRWLQNGRARRTWLHGIYGTPMYALTRKLKCLKPALRALRKAKGDLSNNVIKSKGFLQDVQQLLLHDCCNDLLLCLETVARLVLLKATKMGQSMEAGQGIRDILALNKALMSRHLWNVIKGNCASIWVSWIFHTKLRDKSIWMVNDKSGSWGWRKILRLQHALLPHIDFKIGDGDLLSLWHDPWHSLGPLLLRFPPGPGLMNTPLTTKLSMVITDGEWSWPPIMDMECMEIIHNLPDIHNSNDSITWRPNGGNFTTAAAYDVFHPPGPKVGWSSLLLGPFKIPRYSFVMWLAILEKLSTMDKPWLVHLGGECLLCHCAVETHEHLFFKCIFLRRCLRELKEFVRFSWPNRAWGLDIEWASMKWKGKHCVNAVYRALLASIIYHIWQERNRRVFQHIERPSSMIARTTMDEIRQKILSVDFPDSVSKRGLYRLWCIRWPVEDTA